MKNIINTSSFFNIGTQRALYEKEDGYVSKELRIQEHVKKIKKLYNLNKIYRFDLGQNNDGCDTKVVKKMNELVNNIDQRQYIKNYPEFSSHKLKNKISKIFNVPNKHILLSAGLDQMLIMIASTFLELNDRILTNSPSFYLFEEYSKRMGAVSIKLPLKEENKFRWTFETLEEYKSILIKLRPKLIWISNPNNPTGLAVPDDFIEEIIKFAAENYAFVVMDEAYGEYTDTTYGVKSASRFLKKYNNIIVLRTFSKAYGLGNLRIAYAMANDTDILDALKIHRPYFPITQFSFDYACQALDRINYIEIVRNKIEIRRNIFIESIKQYKNISYIDSDSSIMMIKHNKMSANQFINALEKHGVIVARVPGDRSISERYVRMTLGTMDEIKYFIKILKEM